MGGLNHLPLSSHRMPIYRKEKRENMTLLTKRGTCNTEQITNVSYKQRSHYLNKRDALRPL